MHVEMDKGQKGAKRASWSKLNYRDLALQVCERHPDLEIEDLATKFLQELEKHPGYMASIAIYIMANVKASLLKDTPTRRRVSTKDALAAAAARITARVLLNLKMPSGKELHESTGAECTKAGGWFARIGAKVGPSGIVGEKLTEADLQKMLREAK